MPTGSTASDVCRVLDEAVVQKRVAEMRRQFQRTLANWAGDLLVLRQRGARQPTWQTAASETALRQAA